MPDERYYQTEWIEYQKPHRSWYLSLCGGERNKSGMGDAGPRN